MLKRIFRWSTLFALAVVISLATAACQPIRPLTPIPEPVAPPADAEVVSAQEYLDQGIALVEEGEFELAITAFDEVIRLDPEDAKAYYNRGLAYANLGQYDQAIQDYDEAIQLDPEDAKAYVNRGIAYANLGDFEQAIHDLETALELAPNAPYVSQIETFLDDLRARE